MSFHVSEGGPEWLLPSPLGTHRRPRAMATSGVTSTFRPSHRGQSAVRPYDPQAAHRATPCFQRRPGSSESEFRELLVVTTVRSQIDGPLFQSQTVHLQRAVSLRLVRGRLGYRLHRAWTRCTPLCLLPALRRARNPLPRPRGWGSGRSRRLVLCPARADSAEAYRLGAPQPTSAWGRRSSSVRRVGGSRLWAALTAARPMALA